MEYRRLGKSDLKVSVIGLGTWQFGSEVWGGLGEEQAKPIIEKALELGINFFDTAEAYGNGKSEEYLGKYLKSVREEVVIATKILPQHFRYDDVFKAVNGSLKRLQVDCIDLIQLHWPNPYVPLSETMKALEKLYDEDKIRYIGLSNFPKPLIIEAEKHLSKAEIVSNQVLYNLLERDVEKETWPYMREKGIVLISYSPLAKGLLTGKIKSINDLPDGDFRREHPILLNEENMKQVRALLSIIEDLARKYDKKPAQIVLNWLLRFEDVYPIPGARKPEHVEINAGASGWRLSDADWRLLDEASKRLKFSYYKFR